MNKLMTQPQNLIKGSYSFRKLKADDLAFDFCKSLHQKQIFTGVDLTNEIKNFFPNENIKVKFYKSIKYPKSEVFMAPNSDNTSTFVLSTYQKNYYNPKDISIFTHEFRHIIDSLYHTQYAKREKICANIPNFHKLFVFYDTEIYTKENFENQKEKKEILNQIKNDLLELLKPLENKSQIDVLQYIRYFLQSEKNAYSTEMRYINTFLNSTYTKDILNQETFDLYLFDDKLKLIKQLCLKKIKEERMKNFFKIISNKILKFVNFLKD